MNIYQGKNFSIFFKFSSILLLLIIIFSFVSIYQLTGLPNTLPWNWSEQQWHVIKFLWLPTLIYNIIYLVIIGFLLRKKYFVFPLILIMCIFSKSLITGIEYIFHYGFIYFVDSILIILWVLMSITSVIGSIAWYRNIKYNKGKFWQ
jgi:hypothetical protein